MTDYKALCAELVHEWDTAHGDHDLLGVADVMDRARAGLAAEAEGDELRLDEGYESGSMWTGHPLRPAALAEPEPPVEGENV